MIYVLIATPDDFEKFRRFIDAQQPGKGRLLVHIRKPMDIRANTKFEIIAVGPYWTMPHFDRFFAELLDKSARCVAAGKELPAIQWIPFPQGARGRASAPSLITLPANFTAPPETAAPKPKKETPALKALPDPKSEG